MSTSSSTRLPTHSRSFRGLLLFVGWSLCRCAAPTQSAPARAEPNLDAAADYSLTQRSASAPERGRCPGGVCAEPILPQAPGRCDVELCEGELAPAAVANLRSSAQSATECYENALKDQNQLEGKMLVRLRLAAAREPCDVRIEQRTFEASPSFIECVLERLRKTEAHPDSGCVDVALPLSFVRHEIEAAPDAGSSDAHPSP